LARKSFTWPRSDRLLAETLRGGAHAGGGGTGRIRSSVTPAMFSETSRVRDAACWVLRVISWVAAPCSSTAPAIEVAMVLTSAMVPPMRLIASTASR